MTQNEIEYPCNLKYEALYDRSIDVNIVDFTENEKHSQNQIQLINKYTDECWIVEPFIYIFKQLLHVNQISNNGDDVHTWGFFSADLFFLILAFLQKDEYTYQKYCTQPDQVNLGEVLIQLLKEIARVEMKDIIKIQCKMPGQKTLGMTAGMSTFHVMECMEGQFMHGIEIYHPANGQLIRRYGIAVVQKLK